MRVGIDARLNGYRTGGIAEYTRNLILALARLDKSTPYFLLTAARPQVQAEWPVLANFREIKAFTPPHHTLERLALGAEVLRLRLDVLHSPDFIPPSFGARRVITVHDLNFLHFPQFQTASSLAYYAGNIASAVRDADHILAVSQATADDLQNLLGVPGEKITVQYEGVDPVYRPLPASEVQAALGHLGLPESYVLFVGTIEPRKNIPGLLEAYRLLSGMMSDVPPLLIVGRRGWLYEPIVAAIERAGQRVIWREDIATTDLPAVYNGAAVVALASFYEGFGLPAVEAMACGVPVVVANRGSLPEVVADAGVLVDPDRPDGLADALRSILNDSERRERSILAGCKRAASFTWEQAAEVARSVYEKVC